MSLKIFKRTKDYAYKKLGSAQKSKRKYRRATGRHNKMRQKWNGRPPMVEIGYKRECSGRFLLNEKMPVMVYNVVDLEKIGKDQIGLIGKIGNKNKYEIAKAAKAKNMELANLNINKFIKIMERKISKEKKA